VKHGAAWLTVGLLALAGCDLSTTTKDVVVEIPLRQSVYAPDTVRVTRGTLVRWRNEDQETHTIYGPYWQSSPRAPGETFSLRVNHAGAVTYRCTLHPNERGVLDVD
jgi:plastocyanin